MFPNPSVSALISVSQVCTIGTAVVHVMKPAALWCTVWEFHYKIVNGALKISLGSFVKFLLRTLAWKSLITHIKSDVILHSIYEYITISNFPLSLPGILQINKIKDSELFFLPLKKIDWKDGQLDMASSIFILQLTSRRVSLDSSRTMSSKFFPTTIFTSSSFCKQALKTLVILSVLKKNSLSQA